VDIGQPADARDPKVAIRPTRKPSSTGHIKIMITSDRMARIVTVIGLTAALVAAGADAAGASPGTPGALNAGDRLFPELGNGGYDAQSYDVSFIRLSARDIHNGLRGDRARPGDAGLVAVQPRFRGCRRALGRGGRAACDLPHRAGETPRHPGGNPAGRPRVHRRDPVRRRSPTKPEVAGRPAAVRRRGLDARLAEHRGRVRTWSFRRTTTPGTPQPTRSE
jgi:hypothetical protein